MRNNIPNYIRFIFFLVLYFLYVNNFSEYLAEEWAVGGDVDLILVPLVFGFIMYFILIDDDVVRFLYLLSVPLIVQLALIGEGDPAKPGIEYYFVIYITINFTMGGIMAMGAAKIIKKYLIKEKSENNKE